MILFDPDGGELGLAKRGNARIEQIPLMVSVASDILHDLLKENIKPKDRQFFYCVQINPVDKTIVDIMIGRLGDDLPEGVYFYSCDGRYIFENRGASGGIVTSMCFYLITKE